MNHPYHFVTEWQFPAPLEDVWLLLHHIEDWPRWWRGVLKSTIITNHQETGGVGSVIACTWKSWLPYTISFSLTITDVVHGACIKATATGDLAGTGTWNFVHSSEGTCATYIWEVETTKWWMNLLAPIAKPIFAHAHHTVMRWGYEGMCHELGISPSQGRCSQHTG